MGTRKSNLQGLEFLPLILIIIYKVLIQSSAYLTNQNKRMVLYVFIAISTVIFGYLILKRNVDTTKNKGSIVIVFLLIAVVSVLFYYKK